MRLMLYVGMCYYFFLLFFPPAGDQNEDKAISGGILEGKERKKRAGKGDL